jgi:hypothetical protein
MKGRAGDLRLKALAAKPPEELVEAAALDGYQGVCIDRAGYGDRGAALEARLAELLGAAPVVSPDGRLSFFPLLEYTARLKERVPADEWEGRREALCEPLAVQRRDGFYWEVADGAHHFVWCKADGTLALVNLASHPRRATLRFQAGSYQPGEGRLTIEGAGVSGEVEVAQGGATPFEAEVELPPGTQLLRFHCTAATAWLPQGPVVFCLHNVELTPR